MEPKAKDSLNRSTDGSINNITVIIGGAMWASLPTNEEEAYLHTA